MATSSVLVFNSAPSDNLFDVASDLSPQLGGNLDVNGSSIISTSNANINITPNGSGAVDISKLTVNSAFTLPTSDGSSNQVLQTDGSGSLSWATVSSGGISDLLDDTTPQLGGDLDVNSNSIISASNANISITPNGSGKVVLDSYIDVYSSSSSSQSITTSSGNLFVSAVSGSYVSVGGTAGEARLPSNIKITSSGITTSTTNAGIDISPNGTGAVNISKLSVNSEYTLPTSDGSANQVLQTDGSGNISFGSVSSEGFAIAMGVALG